MVCHTIGMCSHMLAQQGGMGCPVLQLLQAKLECFPIKKR